MSKPGPETRLVKKMRDAAKKKYGHRLVVVKYHGDEAGEAGVSDLLNVLDGVFVAAEVKAPESYGGNVERALAKGPSAKQRAFVQRVNRAGGIGGFAATVDQYLDLLRAAECQARGTEYPLPDAVRPPVSGNHVVIHYDEQRERTD